MEVAEGGRHRAPGEAHRPRETFKEGDVVAVRGEPEADPVAQLRKRPALLGPEKDLVCPKAPGRDHDAPCPHLLLGLPRGTIGVTRPVGDLIAPGGERRDYL